jgi:hypothetical protein
MPVEDSGLVGGLDRFEDASAVSESSKLAPLSRQLRTISQPASRQRSSIPNP